jgi:hypothetical protein
VHGRRNSDNISVLRSSTINKAKTCKMKILRVWKPQGQLEGTGIVATGIIVFAKGSCHRDSRLSQNLRRSQAWLWLYADNEATGGRAKEPLNRAVGGGGQKMSRLWNSSLLGLCRHTIIRLIHVSPGTSCLPIT